MFVSIIDKHHLGLLSKGNKLSQEEEENCSSNHEAYQYKFKIFEG